MSRSTRSGAPKRRGPIEGAEHIGIDTDRERRPGSPMEAKRPTTRAPREQLPDQPQGSAKLHRASIDGLTPVYGSAQPPRGLSGAIRRAAYQIPEHFARHWMLLLLADRVDVLESRAGEIVGGHLESAGLHGPARSVRSHPAAAIAGMVVGAWGLSRLVR